MVEKNDIRNEYVAVIPIEITISEVSKDSNFNEINLSIIASFEKNPDMNGIPIKANLVIPKIEGVSGELIILIPIVRISWYEDSWIIIPAHRNIVDLNNAWIIRWEKASVKEPNEIANIIIAICLNVDKAIIFFMSCSQLADILA